MRPEGVEAIGASTLHRKELGTSGLERAAKSRAVPDEVLRMAEKWPCLPEHIRQAILTLVDSASQFK